MLLFDIDKASVWQKLKTTTEPIIMYGTGNGADKVLDELEYIGVSVSGVTASSGFVRKRVFRGFEVMPIEYFEEVYGEFTVIVAFGTSVPQVMDNIIALSHKHRVLVPCVPVIGTEVFDENFLFCNEEAINKAYELLADDFSKKVYEGYVNFLYGGELDALQSITTPEDEAYAKILKLKNNEVFVDIGAYRGDTVQRFLEYSGGHYKAIIAAEPDEKTFKKLMNSCGDLPCFTGVNCAVADVDGVVGFSHSAGRQSAIGGEKPTDCVTLNTLCRDVEPSFIKVDSEGCELEIFSASPEILQKYKPKLNIAAYHKSEDIFKLPILINEINPCYKIHLRHHPYIPAWDTIFYCV